MRACIAPMPCGEPKSLLETRYRHTGRNESQPCPPASTFSALSSDLTVASSSMTARPVRKSVTFSPWRPAMRAYSSAKADSVSFAYCRSAESIHW
jgi:hypothetical protein